MTIVTAILQVLNKNSFIFYVKHKRLIALINYWNINYLFLIFNLMLLQRVLVEFTNLTVESTSKHCCNIVGPLTQMIPQCSIACTQQMSSDCVLKEKIADNEGVTKYRIPVFIFMFT